MEKGYAMVVDYMDMSGLCPHKSSADKVEAAEQKASTKLAKQVKIDKPTACLMCKNLGHSTKKCLLYKETRKEAQVATRRCYGCNEMGHKVDRCPYKQNKCNTLGVKLA